MFKQNLRQHLEKHFANHELSRWFDPLDMVMDEERGVLHVSFPHTFFGHWFMDTVRGDFERGAAEFSPGGAQDLHIVYEGVARLARSAGGANARKNASPDAAALIRPFPAAFSGRGEQNPSLAGIWTFDSFLLNRKNDFPVAAARKFASPEGGPAKDRRRYSPLVVYGQSGAGKSHLLAAMMHAFKPSGESFFYGDVSFLEHIRLAPGRYAPVSERMVFLDNMQRVTVCPDLQDALVALVDMFQDSGGLLALTLDLHPLTCSGLGQKLRTRLCSGLVVELKRPDLDIRRQYVQQRNSALNLDLTREQVLALAQRFQDIRNIDGALTRLSAYRSLLSSENSAPSSDIAAILHQGIGGEALSPPQIVAVVAGHFSVNPEDLAGKSRDRNVSLARHVAILLCRELLGISLVQTGRIFGGRDHSSVLYSLKKIAQLQENDKVMHRMVEELRKLCLNRH